MKTLLSFFCILLVCTSCKNNTEKSTSQNVEDTLETSEKEQLLNIIPISHATMVLDWAGTIIYVDPVGGASVFKNQPQADVIFITDIHGDHYNEETLLAVTNDSTEIIAPQAVADKIPIELQAFVTVLNSGKTIFATNKSNLAITAIPMYNLREEALQFHPKGRGNGYVIEQNNERIYISGDTEDIPEMRQLENIDVAFVCMNLPYTMPVEAAVSAVVAFQPKIVYPYHYRGTEGLSDVASFKKQVNKINPAIEVIQLDWYSKN